MKYIDLYLNETNGDDKKLGLSSYEVNNNITLLLGPPGCGKTSILKKYMSENQNCRLRDVQSLMLDNEILNCDTLLIDGFDEYRALQKNKTSLVMQVAIKLKSYKVKTILIACRELDWFKNDDAELERILQKDVKTLYVQPLEIQQQEDLANIISTGYNLDNIGDNRLLENPQILKMIVLSDIPTNKNCKKKDIYDKYILYCLEHNESYKANRINVGLAKEDLYDYGGFLSFFIIFAKLEEVNDNILNEICNIKYTKDTGLELLKTKLFRNNKITHRTIAEYLAAHFIFKKFLNKRQDTEQEYWTKKIVTLVSKQLKVPTDLKGVYSWLCTFTKSEELIALEPYQQLSYGDNSEYSPELVKKIIIEIRKKAQMGLFNYDWETQSTKGIYSQELDDFILQELDEIKTIKYVSYKDFISSIIVSNIKDISISLTNSIKKKMLNNEIDMYNYTDFIKIFDFNPGNLFSILEIADKWEPSNERNNVLEVIIDKLYPDAIEVDKLDKYLDKYQKVDEVYGSYGRYLIKTKDKDVLSLLRILFDKYGEEYLTNSFTSVDSPLLINDYISYSLVQLFIKLPVTKLIELFTLIVDMIDKIGYNLSIKTKYYNYFLKGDINDKLEESSDKIVLFYNYFIDKYLSDENRLYMIGYINSMFDFLNIDYSVYINIIIKKLTEQSDPNNIKKLYNLYMGTCDISEVLSKTTHDLFFKKGVLDYYNIEKKKWSDGQSAQKRKDEDRNRKKEREIDENELCYQALTDYEIMCDFGLLYFPVFYFKDNREKTDKPALKNKTLERLKNIYKQLLYAEIDEYKNLTTVESICNVDINVTRKIEQIYFAAIVQNDWSVADKKFDELVINKRNYVKYLYLNFLKNEFITDNKDYLSFMEENYSELVIEALKDNIRIWYNLHFSDTKLFELVTNKVNDINNLKQLLNTFNQNSTSIKEILLYNVIDVLKFDISPDLLKIILGVCEQDWLRIYCEAIGYLIFNEEVHIETIHCQSLFNIISDRYGEKIVVKLSSIQRMKLFKMFMNVPKEISDIQSVKGTHRYGLKEQFNDFLRFNLLDNMTIDELYDVYEYFKATFWLDMIIYQIEKKKQDDANKSIKSYKLQSLSNFLDDDILLTREQFYEYIINKIKGLRKIYHQNRSNQLEKFWDKTNIDGDKKKRKKIENDCRDLVLSDLSFMLGDEVSLTKEKHENDDRRVDINAKYLINQEFEVQIECKRESNKELKRAVNTQLGDKYLKNSDMFGIYLIFNYNNKKNYNDIENEIKQSITSAYIDKIEVICIDLWGSEHNEVLSAYQIEKAK